MEPGPDFCDTSVEAADAFIARWENNTGGAERANYVMFLTELCAVLNISAPNPNDRGADHNNYVFERPVTFRDGGERIGHGFMDLYKRGCFILEAKQSRQRGGKKEVIGGRQDELFEPSSRGKRGAERGWDVLMMNARKQAEDYAQALPADHDWPPFILICDVGHVIEVFADFTGKGRNYTQFPDRQGFRIYLEDLRRPEIRERLRKIWTAPQELDPGRITAKATREIAQRLAALSKLLEARKFPPEQVATFLMRCLFTMFAEDVRLLPEDSFSNLLKGCIDKPDSFPRMVGQLWEAMNTGDFAFALQEKVKRFNGEFFSKNAIALPLNKEEIGELYQAAKADWKQVEPAIFGTLLEQALDVRERQKLGAHYTPRAYVERLVVPTVIEPLREDWRNVLTTAEKLKGEGKPEDAARTVRDFHNRLCQTRVLDPACGTGNFLYVTLELMKRLEGEVLEALASLDRQDVLVLVDPHQFLGIELNPRGASIAELVLWIGYLQWHYRNNGEHPNEPILRAFRNIVCHDALLDWSDYPIPTIKDGKETYPGAKKYEWPQAEFIVGNPPFIGGANMRERLTGPYVEALWKTHKEMNNSADFVMYWWDRAADLLTKKGTVLRRFGFITTNSIDQPFQRRTIVRYQNSKKPISLLMAINHHPWTKATTDAASVRIAMTVAVPGKEEGTLFKVIAESGLRSDEPNIELSARSGFINPDLTIGPNVTNCTKLKANFGVCSAGVKLHGKGFIIPEGVAIHYGLYKYPELKEYIKNFRNGKDLLGKNRNKMVIDFFGLKQAEVRQRFPEIYQHLVRSVKENQNNKGELVGRDANNRDTYKEKWWIFGEPRIELRDALQGLTRYIATVETAKHRIFEFLDAKILPDNAIWAVCLQDSFYLTILSSKINLVWTLACGGTLEDRPKFTKSTCFDPFPFPDVGSEDLSQKLRAVAEELDATRKTVLAEHSGLTMTGLYNVLEKLRAGEALDHGEADIRDRGRVLILRELHDTIDALTFDAYGWPRDLNDEQILERLVALNHARAEEERNGIVRWLRPDYQIPRYGEPSNSGRQIEAALIMDEAETGKPAFPKSEVERTAAVFSALLSGGPDTIDAGSLATTFTQGKKVEKQVQATLVALARMGHLATADDGRTFLFRKTN